jgi:hypothetical protein
VSHYLLMWGTYSKPPEFEPVRVFSVKEIRDGLWVEFEFLEGAARGSLSGAPHYHIITEKEKSIVGAASLEAQLKSRQAKALLAEARATYRGVLRTLADKERTITPEKS